ncbi:MAG: alpha/beta hydrolase [Pseudomonadota bacterium]
MRASGGASWSPDSESGITIDFVEAGELTFEVAKMEPAQGDGDHLAILLHGFPELHFSWRHQIPLLADMGYRVWAPNMRGYGGTSRPEGVAAYTLDKLVKDVAELIDASGAKKVTLVCHDWGGIVGWSFAIRAPRKLERFVAMNIPHPKALERVATSKSQRRKSWYVLAFQIPWLPETVLRMGGAKRIGAILKNTSCKPENFGPEVTRVYREAASRPGATRAMVNYYRALMRDRGAYTNTHGRVEVPTLMVWGDQDVALDVRGTEGTEEWVPDFTLKRLPHASHWVQQDEPGEVNAILKQWLPMA